VLEGIAFLYPGTYELSVLREDYQMAFDTIAPTTRPWWSAREFAAL
jgi:hypothetical protein